MTKPKNEFHTKLATSFACERSVEYILIPQLINEIKKHYACVAPIYPWISREGTRISLEMNKEKKFKVLGVYARRPKVVFPINEQVEFRINSEILLGFKNAKEFGVPMIAGCPLARNLTELSSCKNIVWTDLVNVPEFDSDIQITLNINDIKIKNNRNYLFKGYERIISMLCNDNTALLNMKDIIDLARSIKSLNGERRGGLGYMGGYKPVYLLVK